MSTVLVTYASGTGCTAEVAGRIGETLARCGLEADVIPVEAAPDPSRYDAVLAGSGVRAGSWLPKAKKWLAGNAEALKARPLAMFTVGIALAHGPEKADEQRGYTDKLLAQTGVQPLDIGVFAGWFEPQRFSLLERKVMRMAKAPEGDHRDWNAIEGWAQEMAGRLAPGVRG